MLIDISDEAGEDLTSAIAYLLRVNILAGEQLAADLEQAILNLAVLPGRGLAREQLGPGIRSILVGRHLVLYRDDGDKISIVRVIDGRMDIETEFRR
ncbi:MAG: type II toxin-antitoxin system RelE/ParE family toxin [Alsobacter sp.]